VVFRNNIPWLFWAVRTDKDIGNGGYSEQQCLLDEQRCAQARERNDYRYQLRVISKKTELWICSF
jgi:hypothetical protein